MNIGNSFTISGKSFYWIFLACIGLLLCAYNIYLISVPFTGGREGLPVLLTRLFLEGVNPYTPEMMPTYANPYGIFYNFIVLPFALIFEPDLVLHRSVSATATISSVTILFLSVKRIGATTPVALNISLIWYAQSLVLLNPLARVDAMGIAFYILAISIPFFKNFTKQSFFIAALLAIIAFFIKQYFFLSGLILTITSFFIIGPTFSIILTVFMIGFIIILLSALTFIFPLYIENMILSGAAYYVFSFPYLLGQMLHFIMENIFLLLFFCFLALRFLFETSTAERPFKSSKGLSIFYKNRFNFTSLWSYNWRETKIKTAFIFSNYYYLIALILILPFALFAQGLANSYEAAYLTHLIAPLIFVHLARLFTITYSASTTTILSVSLIWAVAAIPLPERSDDRTKWGQWTDLLSKKNNISAPYPFSILLDDLDKPIYDAGIASTYEWSLQNASLNNAWRIWHYKAFKEKQHQMLLNKDFDLVIRRPNVIKTGEQESLQHEHIIGYKLIRSLRLPYIIPHGPTSDNKTLWSKIHVAFEKRFRKYHWPGINYDVYEPL